METMLKTGAPGDYTSISLATFRHIRESSSRSSLGETFTHRSPGCTPAEFPGDEDERMLFMHQYPSAALEDDIDDDEDLMDEDLDEDLEEDDFDDVSDDDLDADMVDEEEDDEEDII